MSKWSKINSRRVLPLDRPLCHLSVAALCEGGQEGGVDFQQKRGAFELNSGWERRLEGWDERTNRPVFALYTRLLYEKVRVEGFFNMTKRNVNTNLELLCSLCEIKELKLRRILQTLPSLL